MRDCAIFLVLKSSNARDDRSAKSSNVPPSGMRTWLSFVLAPNMAASQQLGQNLLGTSHAPSLTMLPARCCCVHWHECNFLLDGSHCFTPYADRPAFQQRALRLLAHLQGCLIVRG